MKKYYLFIILFTSAHFFAQVKIHKHLTTEDGLVSNRIISIFQDSKGYMWFGTDNGASRWDGINIRNYYTINGLSGSQVFDIKEGHDGTIYFATYGKGITYLKNDSLHILTESNGLLSNWVTKILVRSNGDILLAAENGSISALRNYQIIDWKKEINFPNSSVWALYEDKDSTIYFGASKLFVLKNNKLSSYTHEETFISQSSRQIVYTIEKDYDGNILVGTLQGFYIFQNEQLIRQKINGKVYNNSVVSIKAAIDGTVYLCGEQGVLVKNKNNYEFLNTENGLTDKNVWTAFEDSNGIIYFGTRDQGINIYYPNKIETYLLKNFNNQNITALAKDSKKNLYVGTSTELLLNPNKSEIVENLANGITINSIIVENENQIYIAADEGLFILSKNIIKKFNLVPGTSILNKAIVLYKSNQNDLFVGFKGGLNIFDNNKFIKLNSAKGHNQFIQDLIVLHDSTLVVASHGKGVSLYKSGQEKRFDINNGLSDNTVNCLFETKDNYLLVGTDQGGLNIIQNKIILKKITVNEGLSSNKIQDINEDIKGNIYLSTSKGINIINDFFDSLFVRTILNTDGLVSNSCNLNATYIDDEGIIWIGTNKGITKYDPKADLPSTVPPKIHIIGLEIFNKSFPIESLSSNKGLNYDQNYLKFIYTGINLSAPEKILYKYRLSGVDHGWVESKNNNVQYTSLDNGNYIFEIKARNDWGYWSKPTNLSFTINPAWWETWWFRLAFISAISFMLWLAFQYRLNYLLKLERLRIKIASDLHDEVGSLLTQISVNADSLSYIKDSEKIKEKSGFIRNKSSEVINMMSDVIWSIDSRNDNLDSLVDRINNFAQKFLEQKDIALNFNSDIEDHKRALKIDFRQNVMMIAKEAINNAVKYSECSQIHVNISYKNNLFELVVNDNGKGFDIENVKRGNGLNNMKMRSKLIGAEIEIKNNNGSMIKLIKDKL